VSEPLGSRLVTFRVGTDLYAADIFSVERVLRYQPPRAIPSVPEWLEGVLEYGGRVVPVIDFRRRFGAPVTEPSAQTRLLVLSRDGEWMAAIVDQVLDVRPVGPDEIAPPPPLVRGLAGAYLRGVIPRDGGLVVVLDIDRILGTTDSLALRDAIDATTVDAALDAGQGARGL
jgi:purine-binding chemotaxis protein CheW